jgi:hypothetical protein
MPKNVVEKGGFHAEEIEKCRFRAVESVESVERCSFLDV